MSTSGPPLAGVRAVVTGAARGMGQACATALAEAGAHVVGLDRTPTDGLLTCDVSDPAAVEEAFASAVKTLGGLDVLVHAAGIQLDSPAESIPVADWEQVMRVNALGTVLTNQAAFPHLLAAGGGSLVNFASNAGVQGMPGSAHYAASKGAVLAWTRTCAREWGRHRIRANAIAPGIWTPMYDDYRARMTPEEMERHDSWQATRIPLGGRLGDPARDLAPVVVFLAGSGSRFVTGQTLPVDGGALLLT
jgi:NAD(P)-dependent dehydrogenase (short-subunit alcohol dehydrogenase family)